MAGPRTFDPQRTPLADLFHEVLYTTLRIHQCPDAKAHVATVDALLANTRTVLAEERKLGEALIEGEVGISLRNSDLDEGVAGFKGVLLKKTAGKTDKPLYQRFFKNLPAHEVIRMSLRPQLALMEPWLGSLKAETDVELKDQGAALDKLVTAGKGALSAYDATVQAAVDFRLGKRLKLYTEVNATRQTLYGELCKLGKGGDWALAFFRAGKKRKEETALLTVAEAETRLAAAREQVTEAEADLAEARDRAAKAAAAATAAALLEQELKDAQHHQEELTRKIAALKGQLEHVKDRDE